MGGGAKKIKILVNIYILNIVNKIGKNKEEKQILVNRNKKGEGKIELVIKRKKRKHRKMENRGHVVINIIYPIL